jgi:hypothetical protein
VHFVGFDKISMMGSHFLQYASASVGEWFAIVLSNAPVFGVMVTLGIPRAYGHFLYIFDNWRLPSLGYAIIGTLAWYASFAL